jgi:hypothetical protein
MKRRNRHIVPVGNGGVRVSGLPDLHRWAGLHTSPDMFVYPGESASISSHIRRSWQCSFRAGASFHLRDCRSRLGRWPGHLAGSACILCMSIILLPTTRLRRLFAKHSTSARSRLTFLHNPAIQRDPGRHTPVSLLFSHLLYKGLLLKASPSNLIRAIDLLSASSREETVLAMPSFDEITGGITLANIDRDDYHRYTEASRLVAEKVGLVPGAAGLIINGRVSLTLPIPFSRH